MKKETIVYGLAGLLLGVITGFFAANWIPAGETTELQRNSSTSRVSSGSQVPEGHPPVESTTRASSGQSLPPGHPDISEFAGASTSPGKPTPAIAATLDPLPASSKEKRAEQDYKNIQALKGYPASGIQGLMESFNAALGVDCVYCHVDKQWEKDDKKPKLVTRKEIARTRALNKEYGAGSSRVSCLTCHRGATRPPA